MNCWKCGTVFESLEFNKIYRSDSCSDCKSDLHVCKNCRFYAPGHHNQCQETQAEWVSDKERSNFLLENMPKPTYAAGGSAANTAYWISQLGGQVGFIGKVSDDILGNQFKESLTNSGLKDLTVYETEDKQTGLCAIFITPDGERTMNTYLGAGEYLSVEDLNNKDIEEAEILYMEGYLWDRPSSKEAFLHASKVNKTSNGKNALTLSDVFCVEAHRESFLDLIKENIDYVFCNEDELNA